jgi:hypothetical protein
LFNPNNAANIIFRGEIETTARDLVISLIQVEASTIPDLDTNKLSQRPDAMITTADSLLLSQIPKIIDFLDGRAEVCRWFGPAFMGH